jgi:hypothetical protein
MSKSNASAKNRRAFGGNPPTPPTPQPQQTQQSGSGNGFTLQQVIAVIDRRLLNLETFAKETKDTLPKLNSNENIQYNPTILPSVPELNNNVQNVLDEFNDRFNMLAEEIGSLKDIVLKLQSYTMEVNKSLIDERIRVFSDLGNTNSVNEPQLFELIQSNESDNRTSLDLTNLMTEELTSNSE